MIDVAFRDHLCLIPFPEIVLALMARSTTFVNYEVTLNVEGRFLYTNRYGSYFKCLRGLGIECVKRLRGIFAFGLLRDTSRQLLLLARDPLGVKPLYVFRHDQTLLFASEVRAILATELV